MAGIALFGVSSAGMVLFSGKPKSAAEVPAVAEAPALIAQAPALVSALLASPPPAFVPVVAQTMQKLLERMAPVVPKRSHL